MTEKEKLIARLKEIGVQLNREVNISGTIAELTMRIAELEEELGEGGETIHVENGEHNFTASFDLSTTIAPETAPEITTTTGDRVSVETLATLHIDALHATRNEPVSIVEPGVIIRVSEQDADDLIEKELARKI